MSTARTAACRALHRLNMSSSAPAAHRQPTMHLSTAPATEHCQKQASVHHDTHAQPPQFIQRQHWRYQSMRRVDLDKDASIQDTSKLACSSDPQNDVWLRAGTIPAAQIQAACEAYSGTELPTRVLDAPVFEHRDFPGLQVVPGLLPPETQIFFTSCLMHRDLADPDHKMNLQADYVIPYPPNPHSPESRPFETSFFTRERAAVEEVLVPKDADKHKQLNNEQFLYTKLRWLTLGDQYDWPTRSYAKHATPFPQDLATLVTGLFPHIRPESGVVLIYGAKDFMPVHRDVSEQCQRALASFSVGCDGIFIMARGEDHGEGDNAPRTVAIRVKSGDVVHLTGQARWAWHAMARTIPSTCPAYLSDWPIGTPGATAQEQKRFKKWKGYMGTKRINVSCRQVWD